MGKHTKTICRGCGVLMGQCRCPAKDKTIEYDTCEKCKGFLGAKHYEPTVEDIFTGLGIPTEYYQDNK